MVYMRQAAAGDMIDAIFPLIFAIGCVAYLLDLYAEDLGKVGELKLIVDACYSMVLMLKELEDVLQRFWERTGEWHNVMFRTYPDTRFA